MRIFIYIGSVKQMSRRLKKEWDHLTDLSHNNNFFTLEQFLPMNWTVILHVGSSPQSAYNSNKIRIRFLFTQEYPFTPPRVIFETPVYHPLIRESTICSQMFRLHWNPTRNVLWILQELYKFVVGEGRYITTSKTQINRHKCCIADTFLLTILTSEYPVFEHIVQTNACVSRDELSMPFCQNDEWGHCSSARFQIEKPQYLEFIELYKSVIKERTKKKAQISALFEKYNLPDVHEKMVVDFLCAVRGTREQFWSSYAFCPQPVSAEHIHVQTKNGKYYQIPTGTTILDDMAESSIYLEYISSVEISKILDFLKLPMPPPLRKFQPSETEIRTWPLQFLASEPMSSLCSLFRAANFLGIEHLVILICLKISQDINIYMEYV
jgi:ubiquitin-protein ligase